MRAISNVISVFMFLVIVLGAGSALHAEGGTVTGTIALEVDGRSEPGNWVRLLLVTDRVKMQKTDTSQNPSHPAYFDGISTLHSGFYIQVQNRLEEKGFLYASTLSTDEGTFKFPAVAPGDYYVIVTFPGMIRGYKVAWQIPVVVVSGKTTHLVLNRSNMALPTAKR